MEAACPHTPPLDYNSVHPINYYRINIKHYNNYKLITIMPKTRQFKVPGMIVKEYFEYLYGENYEDYDDDYCDIRPR